MPIIAKGGNAANFKPAPAGLHQGVLCDVIDHGMVETQWGEKHKVTLRWQLADGDGDEPYYVQKRYTNSLHEKAVLRHDLESWRGKEFTGAELAGFDLEKLLGVNGQILVVHKKGTDGVRVWANVQTLMPLGKGTPKLTVREYVRECERATDNDERGDDDGPDFGPEPADTDSVPF
jgi:hypothetical protein